MSQLYAVTYLSPALGERPLPTNPSRAVLDFYAAATARGFPYDVGDDPSFFSAEYFSGPVTWGVCRPDVRGQIKIGDWVCFFAAVHLKGTVEYSFVAAMPVSEKISHTEIFGTERHRKFQHYLNLLIRPARDGWEHHEPALRRSNWHKDWLWRAARKPGILRRELDESKSGTISKTTADAVLSTAPANYVVFDSRSAIVPNVVIPVAKYRKQQSAGKQEDWFFGDRVQTMRSMIFRNSGRSLRTANAQQPHRHFRRELTETDWSTRFNEIVCST